MRSNKQQVKVKSTGGGKSVLWWGEGEIARRTERHLPRPTDSNGRLLTVRVSRSFLRCMLLRSLSTYVSQPTLHSCTLLVWIPASHTVSLSSSGSPQRPAIHHHVIPSLVLKPHPLPPCVSTHRSQRTFSQCFPSRIALHTITFLLLG